MSENTRETTPTASNGIDPNGSAATANQMRAAAADMADAARHQTDVLRETLQDGAKVATDQVEAAKRSVQTGSETIADAIRKNPGLAVGGAVGVGLLLGLALGRGR